jgi:hypothetical protein
MGSGSGSVGPTRNVSVRVTVTVSGVSPSAIVTVPEHFTKVSVVVGPVPGGDVSGSSGGKVFVVDGDAVAPKSAGVTDVAATID